MQFREMKRLDAHDEHLRETQLRPLDGLDAAGGHRRVLVTGGAGFIGSHLCDELLARGREVVVLDNLSPQVHGEAARLAGRPDYLDERVQVVVGDVRDRGLLDDVLADVDEVVHLAAAVGVGQSMYEVVHYTQTNNLGTATLLEAVAERHKRRPLSRLLVASSMSIYGEGRYEDREGRPV